MGINERLSRISSLVDRVSVLERENRTASIPNVPEFLINGILDYLEGKDAYQNLTPEISLSDFHEIFGNRYKDEVDQFYKEFHPYNRLIVVLLPERSGASYQSGDSNIHSPILTVNGWKGTTKGRETEIRHELIHFLQDVYKKISKEYGMPKKSIRNPNTKQMDNYSVSTPEERLRNYALDDREFKTYVLNYSDKLKKEGVRREDFQDFIKSNEFISAMGKDISILSKGNPEKRKQFIKELYDETYNRK